MLRELPALLRGAPDDLRQWIKDPSTKNIRLCLLTITLGCGLYGLTLGLWRAPMMGLYVAFKMPALIFITLACNGLLNGMLGLLLGSGLGFRQSLVAQLVSFTIAALVLGALAPVTFFMAFNAPSPDTDNAITAHANFLVAHTILIAMAGIIANLHLAKLLIAVTPDTRTAVATLAAWLAGNAFVGAQLSWILRPFFGTPSIDVAFLRAKPFDGTFYETVWRAIQRISDGNGAVLLVVIALGIVVLHFPVLKLLKSNNQNQS
jgi:hypothetical protein